MSVTHAERLKTCCTVLLGWCSAQTPCAVAVVLKASKWQDPAACQPGHLYLAGKSLCL